MRAYLPAVVTIVALTSIASAQEPVETILRHDNFMVFEAEAGETVPIHIQSMRKAGFIYGDDVAVTVIDPDSERALRRIVPLGETETIEYEVTTEGMHAVRVSSGWNVVKAEIADRPWALVAWQDVPLDICGAMAPLYFKVLEGVESFTVSAHASVTGEGAALRIYDPDGELVVEQVHDFDNERRIEVEVPVGADGAVWRLSITDPAKEGLNLDDVKLYLGGRIPAFLCEDPDWLEVFTAGARYQPDIIDMTVPVSDQVRLGAGESQTVTWEMEELPAGKHYALRIMGNDVDYPKELMVRINDGEPLAVPMTGNAVSDTFTLSISRDLLKLGENTMTLSQDPGGGSNVVVAGDIEILIGDRIREYRGY